MNNVATAAPDDVPGADVMTVWKKTEYRWAALMQIVASLSYDELEGLRELLVSEE